MGYMGFPTIEEMRTKPECVWVTSSGMAKSHVHDAQITKEARTIASNPQEINALK